jgi:DNA-binding MarR family transcriptional regulator
LPRSAPSRKEAQGLDERHEVGEALLRLGMRLYRLEVEALESLSVPLSVRQYRILDRVDHEIASMTQLAALARRQLPTISKSVDSLVRQGLLARRTSPTDRRVASLELTPAGAKVLREARRALASLATWVGDNLTLEAAPDRIVEAADRLYEAAESRLRAETTNGRAAT